MATPYSLYGSTLSELQSGANAIRAIDAQRAAAQADAAARRFNAIAQLASERQRTQALAGQQQTANQLDWAQLGQEGRLSEREMELRQRELSEQRLSREAAARAQLEQMAEANRIAREDIQSRERIASLPDPRLEVERTKTSADVQALNAYSEAVARQANQRLKAEKQRVPMSKSEAAAMGLPFDADTLGGWRDWGDPNPPAVEQARSANLPAIISRIGQEALEMEANVRYNPFTEQFEAIPLGDSQPALPVPVPVPAPLPAPAPMVNPNDPLNLGVRSVNRRPLTTNALPSIVAPTNAPLVMPLPVERTQTNVPTPSVVPETSMPPRMSAALRRRSAEPTARPLTRLRNVSAADRIAADRLNAQRRDRDRYWELYQSFIAIGMPQEEAQRRATEALLTPIVPPAISPPPVDMRSATNIPVVNPATSRLPTPPLVVPPRMSSALRRRSIEPTARPLTGLTQVPAADRMASDRLNAQRLERDRYWELYQSFIAMGMSQEEAQRRATEALLNAPPALVVPPGPAGRSYY